MPVVSCPKCPTKLKVPDNAKGNVRCPKCGTIFPASGAPAPAPAFEVVDDTPASPPPARAASPRPAPPPVPPPAPAAAKNEFEFDDDKPKSKRRRDDDEDDDRPSRKRRDDDEDDDDRPRSKRRRDDDDDDDRPRRGSRGRRRGRGRDDDDDDDWQPSGGKSSGFGPAKTGVLLMSIGLWMYLGAFAALALFALLGMATEVPDGLMALPGIAGAGNIVITLIGLSFCIGGPQKARGIAIGAVCVAGVHLLLVVICYSKISDGGGRGGVGMGSFFGGLDWMLLATMLWVLDAVLPVLIYAGKGSGAGGEAFLFVAAAGFEVARCILVCLTIKALATSAKDYDAADKAGMGAMMTGIVCGAAAGIALVAVVLVVEGKMMKSAQYIAGLAGAAIFAGYAFMVLPAALAANAAKDSLAYRARRG